MKRLSHRRRQRLEWLGGALFCLVIGGFYLYSGGRTVARDIALAGTGPVAEATVTQRTLNSKGPGVTSINVRFVMADDRPARGTVYEFRRPAPAVGTKLLVRYDAAHPGWYVRDAASGPSIWHPVLLIPLGLATSALGTILLVRPKIFEG